MKEGFATQIIPSDKVVSDWSVVDPNVSSYDHLERWWETHEETVQVASEDAQSGPGNGDAVGRQDKVAGLGGGHVVACFKKEIPMQNGKKCHVAGHAINVTENGYKQEKGWHAFVSEKKSIVDWAVGKGAHVGVCQRVEQTVHQVVECPAKKTQ